MEEQARLLTKIPNTVRQRRTPDKYSRPNNNNNTQKKSATGKLARRQALYAPFSQYAGSDPFPPAMNVKLHYCEIITLSGGAAGVLGNEQVYRLNSCYDPNFSLGGHQVYGWDQLTPLYSRYRVSRVDIEVEWFDPNTDGLLCATTLQPSTGTFSLSGKSADAIAEKPMCTLETISDSGTQRRVYRFSTDIAQIEGVSRAVVEANDPYQAAVGTDPAKTPFLRLAVAKSSSSDNVKCKVRFIYHTHLWGRITQSVS